MLHDLRLQERRGLQSPTARTSYRPPPKIFHAPLLGFIPLVQFKHSQQQTHHTPNFKTNISHAPAHKHPEHTSTSTAQPRRMVRQKANAQPICTAHSLMSPWAPHHKITGQFLPCAAPCNRACMRPSPSPLQTKHTGPCSGFLPYSTQTITTSLLIPGLRQNPSSNALQPCGQPKLTSHRRCTQNPSCTNTTDVQAFPSRTTHNRLQTQPLTTGPHRMHVKQSKLHSACI